MLPSKQHHNVSHSTSADNKPTNPSPLFNNSTSRKSYLPSRTSIPNAYPTTSLKFNFSSPSSKNTKNIFPNSSHSPDARLNKAENAPDNKTTGHQLHKSSSIKSTSRLKQPKTALTPESSPSIASVTSATSEDFASDQYYLEEMRRILSTSLIGHRSLPQPVELVAGLFMGTQRHADDYPLLKQLAITHVVNCAGSRLTAPLDECVPAELYPQEVGIKECMVVGALDHEDYDISKHFDKVLLFMEAAVRGGGKILVHCNLGVNRSGAVAAAYLMTSQNLTLLATVALLKKKRQMVLSNKGFRRQIVAFARKRGCLDRVEQPLKATDHPLSAFLDPPTSNATPPTSSLSPSTSSDKRPSPTTVRFQLDRNNIINLSTQSLPQQPQSHFENLKQRIRSAVKPAETFKTFTQSLVKKVNAARKSSKEMDRDERDVDKKTTDLVSSMKKLTTPVTLATIEELDQYEDGDEDTHAIKSIVKTSSAPDFNSKLNKFETFTTHALLTSTFSHTPPSHDHSPFSPNHDFSEPFRRNTLLSNPLGPSSPHTLPTNADPSLLNDNSQNFKTRRKVAGFFRLPSRLSSKRHSSFLPSLQASASTLSLADDLSLEQSPRISTMRPLRISVSKSELEE